MVKKIIFFILIIFLLFIYYSEVDSNVCNTHNIDINNYFLRYIDSMSEKNKRAYLIKNDLIGTGAWNDPNLGISRYTAIENTEAIRILKKPDSYICETAYVVSSKNYDQSQKAYVIMLSQKMSMKNHIYLLKIANKAYENGIITDKEVLAELLYSPELEGNSTNSKYTWVPAWRREFKKHAHEVLNQEQINNVLSGKTLLWGW